MRRFLGFCLNSCLSNYPTGLHFYPPQTSAWNLASHPRASEPLTPLSVTSAHTPTLTGRCARAIAVFNKTIRLSVTFFFPFLKKGCLTNQGLDYPFCPREVQKRQYTGHGFSRKSLQMTGTVFSSGEPGAELGLTVLACGPVDEPTGPLTGCSALRHRLALRLKTPEATQPVGAARLVVM